VQPEAGSPCHRVPNLLWGCIRTITAPGADSRFSNVLRTAPQWLRPCRYGSPSSSFDHLVSCTFTLLPWASSALLESQNGFELEHASRIPSRVCRPFANRFLPDMSRITFRAATPHDDTLVVKHFTDMLLAMNIPIKSHILTGTQLVIPHCKHCYSFAAASGQRVLCYSDQGIRELASGVDREQQCLVFIQEARAHYQLNTIIAEVDGTPYSACTVVKL